MAKQVKALVVGGGAVGTSIAYHLAKAGWSDVALLERDELTSGSTWHAAGLLPLFNMGYATSHIHDYSVKFYKTLEEETGLDAGFFVVGNLRMAQTQARMDECPLGSAALAGTGFDLDRNMTAESLGFARPTRNSLDAVSDRDFALDYLMAASQCSLHLSRLAEEFIIWASQPFGFVRLPDSLSTGSSIMPQKKNPDAAELVRGHAGRIIGAATALSITMKGLPLAYAKDMQDDKPPVFEAHGLLTLSLAACEGMIAGADFDTERMLSLAGSGHSTATDLADWLVREAGVPFREAHHITGAAVARADAKGCALAELTADDLAAIDPRVTPEALLHLSLEGSVASRQSYGGTAPDQVRKQVKAARKALGLDT